MAKPASRVLVTGANRGLGLQTCRELAARGFEVWLAARNTEDGERAARAVGGNTVAVALDVSSPASIAELVRRLDGRPLDILVNNAGIALKGFDADVVRRTLEVNYFGARNVTLQLLPNLSTRANVVMVSSGMGELSSLSAELKRAWLAPDLSLGAVEELLANYVELVTKTPRRLEGWPSSAYSVSKIALNALTRVLSREWAKSERRVNAVCPGWVRTDMGGQAASRSVEAGARGIVWAALGAEGVSGGFFRDGKPIDW